MSITAISLLTATHSDASTTDKIYRKADVELHNTLETGYWVSFKGGVYDITDFIANHPGGKDRLLTAAGKDLELFWRQATFRQHYNSPLAHELLEEMRIGTLHPNDILQDASDPFRDDPTYPNNVIYECIVVGAGVSGLQCARSLVDDHLFDPKSILLLEAQDYVGGRVRQVTGLCRMLRVLLILKLVLRSLIFVIL
jgi:cytochrome b involved in lipid metabolism